MFRKWRFSGGSSNTARRLSCAGVASVLILAAWRSEAGPIGYVEQRVRGVPVRMVVVNMNDRNVRLRVALAHDGLGCSERFSQFVARTRPTAAVTGTYFDMRSLLPVGDLVVDGRYVYRGCVGTALVVRDDNRVELRPRSPLGAKYPGCRTVIASGPRLVANGRAALNPRSEGFRDRGLFRRTYRVAVGVTKTGKLLLVNAARPVSMWELARIMAALGAREAINLDGGTSTAMYYRGRILANPGRRLTNVLVAYERTGARVAHR